MNEAEDQRLPEPAKPSAPRSDERPPVALHDPFSRFEFEPTDGGDF